MRGPRSGSGAMPDVRLRSFEPSDQDAVRALILTGLEEHWGSLDEALNEDLIDLARSYASGRIVVAEDDAGEIVGTGTVVPRADGVAELVRVSVARRARRGGVGAAVVRELLLTARGWGADRAVLETTSSWTEVEAFWITCGFVVAERTTGPFGSDTWFDYQL